VADLASTPVRISAVAAILAVVAAVRTAKLDKGKCDKGPAERRAFCRDLLERS
jgi:hypothetical protein